MIETTMAIKLIYNTFVVLISSILAYLSLDSEVLMLFAILLVIDYITGLHKAKTLGQSITSNKMKYGIVSKLLLLLVPIVLAIGAKAIDTDFHFILKVGMWILVASEVYSILGNIYSSRTKEEFPEYDAVAEIGKLVKQFLLRKSGDKDA